MLSPKFLATCPIVMLNNKTKTGKNKTKEQKQNRDNNNNNTHTAGTWGGGRHVCNSVMRAIWHIKDNWYMHNSQESYSRPSRSLLSSVVHNPHEIFNYVHWTV